MWSVCRVSPRASVWVLFPTMQKPEGRTIHRSDWLDCSRGHRGCAAKQSADRPRDARPRQHVLGADAARAEDSSPPPGRVCRPRWPRRSENLAPDRLLWPGLGAILQNWLRIYEAEKTGSREELGHRFRYWKLSDIQINLPPSHALLFSTNQCSCLLFECLWLLVFSVFFSSVLVDTEETFFSPCTGQCSPGDYNALVTRRTI